MYMRDKLGSFELIVDRERRVVHEKLSGLFTFDDSDRLEKEYMHNIIPFLGQGDWVKLCDMTEYIPNTSVGIKEIKIYLNRMIPFGFVGCAIISENPIIRTHLFSSVEDMDAINLAYFESEEDANQYLRQLGF